MPFFKSKKNKNRRTDGGGFTTYDDVYQIVKDNIDEAVEFYELEPAVVTDVFLDPKSLPRKDIAGGDGKMPDYSYLGTIRARFIESQSDGDVIDDYIKPLSPHMVAYPLIGEVVNIAKHGSQMYYYQPLNLKNHVNMNLANNTLTDPRVTSRTTEFNRNLLSEYGDVVFNSKKTDIHMFARRNLNLSANEEINLELGLNAFGGRITLGDAESTNPMVLGNQLEDLFEKLFSSLESFSNSVSKATGIAEVSDASKVMLDEVQNIKSNILPKMLSDTVYITENQSEEITEINDVDAEVQPIIQVAGVRG